MEGPAGLSPMTRHGHTASPEGKRVAGDWVLLGTTGLVLPAAAQSPARLVYGSAALVASLRGQPRPFATLPISVWAQAHVPIFMLTRLMVPAGVT